jgi:tripartite-type tricarboxylate transporter receptor subunit TctC
MSLKTLRKCLVLLGALFAGTAMAQVAQPMRLIVPFATGGGTDIGARIVAPYLTELMKRPVIVENKPGAGGAIGIEQVAHSSPDGTTVLVGSSSSMGASPTLMPDLPYDVLKDFSPVGTVHTGENVLVVHPSVPAGTLREFIAYAKANPGRIAYGSSGIGSTYHLGSELFASQTGVVLTHVPYKGASPAVQALLTGEIQMMMEATYSALPNIKAGRVKPLGIASRVRNPDLPNVPTFIEQGVSGCEFSNWIALFLPANARSTLVKELNADLNAVLAKPDVEEKFAKLGVRVAPGTPEQLAELLRSDLVRWTKVVREARIKPE